MNFSEFNDFMETLYEEVKTIRDQKGQEYAHDDADRFANFTRDAVELGRLPLEIAYIHFKKHLHAIASYIKNNGQTYSHEPIRGRFADLIGYAFLMAGMAEDIERIKEWDANRDQGIPIPEPGMTATGTRVLETYGEVLQAKANESARALRIPRGPRAGRAAPR